MENASKINLRLHSLRCLLSSELDGDEVYVAYNGKKIWPADKKWHHIVQGDEVAINVEYSVSKVGRQVELELWECDIITKSKLGNFTFLPDGPGGPFTVDMLAKNGKAKYSLMWEVLKP